jgi:hypothetical protein
MADCQNMKVCSFFIAYGAKHENKTAVAGFVRLYCRGERQDQCVRKAVSKALGGPHTVPANMLPNGLPMTGTTDKDWSDDIKKAVRRK